MSRWHLKQPRKLLWPQDIFFFLQSGFDLDQLTMDAQFSRNRPVARRKDIFLRYFSFLFCLGLAGGPNSWQVISFKSRHEDTFKKLIARNVVRSPKET